MWIKGLLTSFDFIEFAKEHKVEPIVKDCWGDEHNLIEENIQVVLTESQFKLYKYYDNWQDYKDKYHENNCYLCRTNYEEDEIGNSEFNYQFLQTLLDITDEEINEITKGDYENIHRLGTTVESQLSAFGCYKFKEKSNLQKALLLYPELLRDGYCREQLKDIKKMLIYNAQGGRLNLENKRLFVVPDPYAAWERILLHVEQPKGLLRAGYIYTADPGYDNVEEIDLLRSPHLYIEHAPRKFVRNEIIKKWFITKAVYTSFDDIASRILQFKQN